MTEDNVVAGYLATPGESPKGGQAFGPPRSFDLTRATLRRSGSFFPARVWSTTYSRGYVLLPRGGSSPPRGALHSGGNTT